MNTIKNLFIALVVLFSTIVGNAYAVSVTVSIVPGGNVGLSDLNYYAGFVTLNINGKDYPAMMDNWSVTTDKKGWQNDPTPWNGVFYTYGDIQNTNTQVVYTLADYSKASWFLTNGMVGYKLKDNLWAASYDEMVWDTLSGIGVWEYSSREYPSAGSGITMLDGYNMDIANGSPDPNYDFSSFMGVLNVPYGSNKEFLVFTQKNGTPVSTPDLPIPPAIWLFGSGLVGLTVVARKKKQK